MHTGTWDSSSGRIVFWCQPLQPDLKSMAMGCAVGHVSGRQTRLDANSAIDQMFRWVCDNTSEPR